MPTVSIIVEDAREREALGKLLAKEDFCVEVYSDISAFQGGRGGEAACLVLGVSDPKVVIDSIARLRAASPRPSIVVLSPRAAVPLAVQAMKEGAADFLEKPVDSGLLIRAVRAALEAGGARSERTKHKRELIERFRTLSARERDVVDAVLGGSANHEVASRLGIKPRTVETHRSNAMNKLGARTLPDLVRIWLDLDAGASP